MTLNTICKAVLFSAAFVATIAITSQASAMAIGVVNPNPQAQQAGIQVIPLNGAQCDNDVRPSSCDLFFYSSKGKILRVKIDFNARVYSYISASNRSFRQTSVPLDDLDVLARLSVALERLGIDCNSAVVVEEKSKQIVQVVPGCDI